MVRIHSLLILLFLVTSCVGSGEEAIFFSDSPSNEKFDVGEFMEFRIPSLDTALLYNVDLYARVHSLSNAQELPILLKIISPEGRRFIDTIRLNMYSNLDNPIYAKSGAWRDYRWSYRSKVNLPERGTWYLRVELIDGSTPVDGLVEFGFILNKR